MILVEIDYTNHAGERRKRVVRPGSIAMHTSAYHSGGAHWILFAMDWERREVREFLMSNIHSWRELTPAEQLYGQVTIAKG